MSEFHIPRVMGIVNCTPDSFFAGSRRDNVNTALDAALDMIRDGAEILDIGGESTRPGSAGVDAEEQIARVVPVIRELRALSDITISVDTQNAAVAEAALDAGADIINDISALHADGSMAPLAAERGVPVILMHMKGTPATMQNNPEYGDPVREIRNELLFSAEKAISAGIKKENIILDPGIGFGKRQQDNIALLSLLRDWRPEEFLLLVGLSRKSFLGNIINAENTRCANSYRHHLKSNSDRKDLFPPENARSPVPSLPEDRLTASIAAHAWCLNQGVDILRVHDVKETRQLIAVWEALSWAS
jgi:dihydropteroate synthase